MKYVWVSNRVENGSHSARPFLASLSMSRLSASLVSGQESRQKEREYFFSVQTGTVGAHQIGWTSDGLKGQKRQPGSPHAESKV